MQKNSFISNFKKNLPWGFIICLIFFFITESFIRKNIYTIIGAENSLILQKKQYLNSNKQLNYTGIILGDSRILNIDAKRISKTFTRNSNNDHEFYNFSVPYSDIRTYYLLLKNYLAKHKKPEYILFSSMPEATFEGWNLLKKMPDDYTYIYRFCLLFSLKDLYQTFPLPYFLKYLPTDIAFNSYTVMYRAFIRAIITGQSRFRINVRQRIIHSMEITNGGMLLGRQEGLSFEELEASPFYDQSKIINENSIFWLEKFFELAKKEDIKIILFNIPIIQPFYYKRMKNGFNKEYVRSLNKILEKYDNIIFIGPKLKTYNKKYFGDSAHLNAQGFQRFNKELNQKLEGFLQENSSK